MELKRNPRPGQVWQHFKGNTYRILICTGVQTTMEEWIKLPGEIGVKHSENLAKLQVVLTTDHKIALLSIMGRLILEPHVVYQQYEPNVLCPSPDPSFLQAWARPLDIFLEIISTPYVDGVVSNNYPRFTRIS